MAQLCHQKPQFCVHSWGFSVLARVAPGIPRAGMWWSGSGSGKACQGQGTLLQVSPLSLRTSIRWSGGKVMKHVSNEKEPGEEKGSFHSLTLLCSSSAIRPGQLRSRGHLPHPLLLQMPQTCICRLLRSSSLQVNGWSRGATRPVPIPPEASRTTPASPGVQPFPAQLVAFVRLKHQELFPFDKVVSFHTI